MLRSQKLHISKIIDKICSNDFDLGNIRDLFISLRPYSNGNTMFQEYADFVAHPDRDKGIIKEALAFFQLKAKVQRHYVLGNRSLDAAKPFPDYFRTMFLYIANNVDQKLLQKYKVKKANLKNTIKQDIIGVPGTDECILSKVVIEKLRAQNWIPELALLFDELLSQETTPALTQKALIDGLVSVIKSNNIQFNESRLRAQSDKIILLILANLHKSSFKMDSGEVVRCIIKGIEYRITDKEGKKVIMAHHLNLSASIRMEDYELDGVKVPMSLDPVIMQTSLPAHIWCSPETFTELANHFATTTDHDFDVVNYRLVPILPYEGEGGLDITFHL